MNRTGEPLSIIRVIARMNTGGPARHVGLLSERLSALGHDHHLIRGSIEEDEGDMAGLLTAGSGTHTVVPSMRRTVDPVADLVAAVKIARIIRREQPDIVHTHTAKAGLVGRLAAILARTPVTLHTYHGHVFNGYFGRAQTHFYLTIERLLARKTTRLISLSPTLISELSNEYRIGRPDQYELVSLGLPLENFLSEPRGDLRAELGLPDDAVLIGSVGRVVPIKDFELLVRAFARLAHAEPGMHLVLAGDGEGKEKLIALADDLGIGSQAHFLGWRDDMQNIVSSFDAFALTSKNEGTPVSIIEAMAAGTPVAALAVGGVADLLKQGVGGELIRDRDPAAVAKGIERALETGRGDIEGRRTVVERFGPDQLVDRLDALMRELVADESGRRGQRRMKRSLRPASTPPRG